MSALAEQQAGAETGPSESSVVPVRLRSIRVGPGVPDEPPAQATRWNVLAQELIAYPPKSQKIWLDRGEADQAPTPLHGRAYADAWLERELDALRDRRRSTVEREAQLWCPPSASGHRSGVSRQVRTSPRTAPERVRRPAGGGSVIRAAGNRACTTQTAARHGKSATVIRPRGLRRLLPGAATLAVLGLFWCGVSALAAPAHQVRIVQLPGSKPVHGGFVYVARPGDTLWSIASKIEPGADPRPLVDQLQAELGGTQHQP
ncbi:MAG: hypothetical protein ACYDBS_05645, partial [Acidimicrobiales bacterium]